MHGTGSSPGAAAVFQPVGCLGQERCLSIHFLNSLGHGVTCGAEQRGLSWTLGCFLLQQDVLGFVWTGDASLCPGETALYSPGLTWRVSVPTLAVVYSSLFLCPWCR